MMLSVLRNEITKKFQVKLYKCKRKHNIGNMLIPHEIYINDSRQSREKTF